MADCDCCMHPLKKFFKKIWSIVWTEKKMYKISLYKKLTWNWGPNNLASPHNNSGGTSHLCIGAMMVLTKSLPKERRSAIYTLLSHKYLHPALLDQLDAAIGGAGEETRAEISWRRKYDLVFILDWWGTLSLTYMLIFIIIVHLRFHTKNTVSHDSQ